MRVRDWDGTLIAWGRAMVGRPFTWGTSDCATCVRTAVFLMYGHDRFTLHPWRSASDLATVVAGAGGVTAVLATVADPIAVRRATTGDVVQFHRNCTAGLDALAVVIESAVLMVRDGHPATLVPLRRLRTDTLTVWRVRDANR